MKRRDNSQLKDIFTIGVSGEQCQTVTQLLSQVWGAIGNRREPKFVRILIDRSADFLQREWFAASGVGERGDIAGNWKLQTYNHETRSALYVSGDRKTMVTRGANWIGEGLQYDSGMRGYFEASSKMKQAFGFACLASPTMTGLYQIEASLPFKVDAQSLPDEFAECLHRNTPQARTELYENEAQSFWYFDRRFAYAADCRREMPCGELQHVESQEPQHQMFVPYKPGFYRVAVEVPKTWNHVGLLPVLTESGWKWIAEPGAVFETFVAEPELRLAYENGWYCRVLESWTFPQTAKPLEAWRNKLVGLWQVANEKKGHFQLSGNERERDAVTAEATVYRKTLLNAIGGLYARTYKRERMVDESEIETLTEAEALSAERIEGNRYRVDDIGEREKRFYMPHWTAYVWSYARRELAKRMLEIPKRDLIGCHVDAIYSSRSIYRDDADPGRLLDQSIGAFRMKGVTRLVRPEMIDSFRRLSEIREQAERGE